MNTRYEGGYAGLVMLMITTLIISFLVWRTDLLGAKPVANSPTSGQPAVQAPTSVQGQIQSVQKARDAASMLEKQNQLQMEQL